MIIAVNLSELTMATNGDVDPVGLSENFRALKQPLMEHFRALKCSSGGGFRALKCSNWDHFRFLIHVCFKIHFRQFGLFFLTF